MKILVIPDIHLKPWILDSAEKLYREQNPDKILFLGDIPDDWNQEYNISLYEETLNRVIQFVYDFPDTLLCYGNHDVSYLWNFLESGFSDLAVNIVNEKLVKLIKILPNENQLTFVHKIDNVIFSHAGISDIFVKSYVRSKLKNKEDDDEVIQIINNLDKRTLWSSFSPLWIRPQLDYIKQLWKPDKYIQVVGHTPMEQITKDRNLISCDVFSTYKNGTPYGSQEFIIIDTVTGEYITSK